MRPLVMLLGRRDTPVDGIEDYCSYLGRALASHDIQSKICCVDWHSDGWLQSFRKLWTRGRDWRGQWVILQYTALAWSRRGFPLGAAIALAIVKRRGARCAVVFHEPLGLSGPRPIDRVRGACQNWVVRKLHGIADKCIFPAPLETIGRLSKDDLKSAFIPIGANIPRSPLAPASIESRRFDGPRTVAIFCLSGPPILREELEDISEAAAAAKQSGAEFRLLFLGRGTLEASEDISLRFKNLNIEISNLGLVSAERVAAALAESDAMLCVRGRVYLRRGSAIAGIACGLPILGYGGEAENTVLSEAGLLLVPYRDGAALGVALGRVMKDRNLQLELREASLRAYEKYFSWDSIASRFVTFLGVERA